MGSIIAVRAGIAPVLSVTLIFGLATSLQAGPALQPKDQGPLSAACDRHVKASPDWVACVGAPRTAMPDEELFYAGYWLAKSGRYVEATSYLNRVRNKDERVLTYLGYAARKQGDMTGALASYAAALERNPDFVVARAYLGEAYLTMGQIVKARAELAEIAKRCGTTCPAHSDLDHHIAAFMKARG